MPERELTHVTELTTAAITASKATLITVVRRMQRVADPSVR
ncbi:hypothetical protein [Actinoallomurus oryzae]